MRDRTISRSWSHHKLWMVADHTVARLVVQLIVPPDDWWCHQSYVHVRSATNDRIATQIYLTPEIPIGSRVMSRTTSAPTGGRARKVVAIIAGCRKFSYISRLSCQHCIHDRRSATKFDTHVRTDMGQIRT